MKNTKKKILLSAKQKEIVKLMREGWILLIARSDTTDRIYYQITHGYEKVYFNATVYANLLSKNLIHQESCYPFDYVLTTLGETITL